MSIDEMMPWDQVLEQQLPDPEFRAEWERLAPAREIAHRLIAYRARHGLTQRALARRLGLSLSTIADLKDAEQLPTAEVLVKIEAVPVDVLEAVQIIIGIARRAIPRRVGSPIYRLRVIVLHCVVMPSSYYSNWAVPDLSRPGC